MSLVRIKFVVKVDVNKMIVGGLRFGKDIISNSFIKV